MTRAGRWRYYSRALVPRRGLEPPLGCPHKLILARLPILPPWRGRPQSTEAMIRSQWPAPEPESPCVRPLRRARGQALHPPGPESRVHRRPYLAAARREPAFAPEEPGPYRDVTCSTRAPLYREDGLLISWPVSTSCRFSSVDLCSNSTRATRGRRRPVATTRDPTRRN